MRHSPSHRRPGARISAPAGERGASVVFAVVFLIVVSTLVSGALAYSSTASRSVIAYQRDRALHYAADGALEVAVQMGEDRAGIGVAGGPSCSMILPLGGAHAVHDPGGVFSDTARLVVTCAAATATSGTLDGAGFQQTREVIFTVLCRLPDGSKISERDLSCAKDPADTQEFVLGRARVRYDVDPGWAVPATRARVPKVIEWELLR